MDQLAVVGTWAFQGMTLRGLDGVPLEELDHVGEGVLVITDAGMLSVQLRLDERAREFVGGDEFTAYYGPYRFRSGGNHGECIGFIS